MKIGIVTKIGKNYGAILQAYALKKKLCDLGQDAHIIKYAPKQSRNTYKICKYPWRFRGALANLKAISRCQEYREAIRRFYRFRDENYGFIGEFYNDAQIEANPPECDVYITGSDQDWNPVISFDRAYYCSFAKKYPTAKLAAYAASIGLSEIPREFAAEFKNRVENFDYVSVREKQAAAILREMGIEAKLAPDPTLLLQREEWRQISSKVIDEPYILCYFVSYPHGIEKTVKQVQKKLGLKVVNLMLSEISAAVGDIKIRNAGPKEFLGLFENATFVVTSSFHGTVFSIINKKPFVSTLYKSTSSRVTELLDNLGLSERIIEPSCKDIAEYCDNEIYTNAVEEKLTELRQNGVNVLKEISGELNAR